MSAPADAGAAVAEVLALAHAYEEALAAGDAAAATGFFDDGPQTSRFGPEGAALDLAAVRAVRAAAAPAPTATWVADTARALGPDHVLHLCVLERGGATIQRTQVWVRRPGGWRITHAHVARRTAPGAGT